MKIVSVAPPRGSRLPSDYHGARSSKPMPQTKITRSSTSRMAHRTSRSRNDDDSDAAEERRHAGSARRAGWDMIEERDPGRRHRSKREGTARASHSNSRHAGSYHSGGAKLKPLYPKEKWVPSPPNLVQTESDDDQLSMASSTDAFLHYYTKYGKYQVDKHSLGAPRISSRGDDKERYDTWSKSIRSDSSDSGIANWRSDDEDDEDDSEGDWDTTPMDRRLSIAFVPTSPNDDDVGELESMEMIHFDPTKAMALTNEHRFDPMRLQRSASFPVGLGQRNSKSLQLIEEEDARKAKEGNKSNKWGVKTNPKNETHKGGKVKQGSSSKPIRPQSESDLHKQPLLRSKFMARVASYSSISNSSAPSNRGSRRMKWGQSKHKKSSEYVSDDEDAYESDHSFDQDEDSEDDLSSESSGSMSFRAQEAFRRKKRAEHRRWVAKRNQEQVLSSTDPTTTLGSEISLGDYYHENKVNAAKFHDGRRAAKASSSKGAGSSISSRGSVKGIFFRLGRRGKLAQKTDSFSEEGTEPLPWEVTRKKGFIKRLAAKVLPSPQPAMEKEELPFPTSDSMDASLMDSDKYRDMLDELPVLSQTQNPAPHCGTTISSMSYTLPQRRLPQHLRRAKHGMGKKLMAIFQKPF